jgi:hypothetical protein
VVVVRSNVFWRCKNTPLLVLGERDFCLKIIETKGKGKVVAELD